MTQKKINPLGNQIIVVTGGIASGKTFLVNYLKKYGFLVFNTDRAIDSFLEPTGIAHPEISKKFPEALINGNIDKKILSKIVFSNVSLLAYLESILHPLIADYRKKWIDLAHNKSLRSILIEIPLFFEKKVSQEHDLLISTICSVQNQKNRALNRKSMSEETIEGILSTQTDNIHRIKNSDIIIDTDCSEEETIAQIEQIITLS